MFRPKRFFAAIALVTALGTFGTGCFGTFALTRKVYAFNKGIGPKFVQTILFWAMNIVPIYSIAGTIDIVILNLIEFWTGSNPVAMGSGESHSRDVEADGRVLRLTLLDQGRMLQVGEVVNGELVNVVQMSAPDDAGMAVVTRLDGTLVATSHAEAGRVIVEDARGELIDVATADEVTTYAARIERASLGNLVSLAP